MKDTAQPSFTTVIARPEPKRGRRVTGPLVLIGLGLAAGALGRQGFASSSPVAPVKQLPTIVKLPETPPVAVAPVTSGQAIDVAICLDTSGSMNGLIESVKQKLWDVTNELGRARPAPRIRVALLTFGSPEYGSETGFVRVASTLTEDLDTLQQKLFALGTSGGDEFVGRVVKTAIDQLPWSTEKDALKIVFVCGNESADQDRVVHFRDAAREAWQRGVFVNAIYCGDANDAQAPLWREIPALGHGAFAAIDHNQKVVEIPTPFDDKILELSTRINTTYIPCGADGEKGKTRQEEQDRNSSSMGKGSGASRGEWKGSRNYKCEWDLIDRLSQTNLDVDSIKNDDLPENMRKMSFDEKRAYVAAKNAERTAIQKEMAELRAKRSAFIAEEQRKSAEPGKNAIDQIMKQAIREQAMQRGFLFGC